MRLYGEIMRKTGMEELFHAPRCSVLLGGGGYFQGVKGVNEFTSEKIVLCFKGGEVEVTGKSFSIAKYQQGDLEIAGEIYSFSYLKR